MAAIADVAESTIANWKTSWPRCQRRQCVRTTNTRSNTVTIDTTSNVFSSQVYAVVPLSESGRAETKPTNTAMVNVGTTIAGIGCREMNRLGPHDGDRPAAARQTAKTHIARYGSRPTHWL